MRKCLFLLTITLFSHCHNKYRLPKDTPPIGEKWVFEPVSRLKMCPFFDKSAKILRGCFFTV